MTIVLAELGITDVDLSPGPELVDTYLRLGRHREAQRIAAEYWAAAKAKGQPWSLARALRTQGLLADDAQLESNFELVFPRFGGHLSAGVERPRQGGSSAENETTIPV